MLSRGLLFIRLLFTSLIWRKGIRARKFAITLCRKFVSNFVGKISLIWFSIRLSFAFITMKFCRKS